MSIRVNMSQWIRGKNNFASVQKLLAFTIACLCYKLFMLRLSSISAKFQNFFFSMGCYRLERKKKTNRYNRCHRTFSAWPLIKHKYIFCCWSQSLCVPSHFTLVWHKIICCLVEWSHLRQHAHILRNKQFVSVSFTFLIFLCTLGWFWYLIHWVITLDGS